MSSPLRTPESPQLGRLPLARGAIDRGSERRTSEELFAEIRDLETTRVLYFSLGKALVREDALVLDPPGPDGFGEEPVYLGRTLEDGTVPAGADIVMVTLAEPDPAMERAGARWAGLRDVAVILGSLDAGLFVEACAVANWHATHTHCPRCGAPTRVVQAGWSRVCDVDGSEHYPRTDPAVIMAVVDDDDRLLLGRSTAWPAGRFSTLAGFVEAGEAAEQAVRREVLEETGVVVDDVEYAGSQPWPFPASLMLGFRAHATTTAVRPDGVELAEARWFTRAELARAVRDGELRLPGVTSIARALVEQWWGGDPEV